jgi:hypothetical protein
MLLLMPKSVNDTLNTKVQRCGRHRLNTIHHSQRNVIAVAKVGERCVEYQSSTLLETPSQPSGVCCQFIVGWILCDEDIISQNAGDEY